MINDLDVSEEIILFLKGFKQKQETYSETENLCYTKISLYLAAKHNIFFNNFLLHPLVLSVGTFFEEKRQIEENQIEFLIATVLEFELTTTKNFLSEDEIKKLIKVYNLLKIKNEPLKAISNGPSV